jgi:hypothetical protein
MDFAMMVQQTIFDVLLGGFIILLAFAAVVGE